ncbi:MAG: MarR family winged helix-turn-helix transcriptional regulator [Mycoplasma sp.]
MYKDKYKMLDTLNQQILEIISLYEQWSKKYNLNHNSLAIMYLINNNWFITQKQICDSLSLSKTTVNSILQKFIDNKWVTLVTNEVNRKEKNINLTKEGNDHFQSVINQYYVLQSEVVENISVEDMAILVKTMDKLSANVKITKQKCLKD